MSERPANSQLIPPEAAPTLDLQFAERARKNPEVIAYRAWDESSNAWQDHSWRQMSEWIGRWQAAMRREGLAPGDRVAVMLKNCPAWVAYDQAALGLGMVVVPLYTADRPDNVAYIIQNSGSRLLLIEDAEQWSDFLPVAEDLRDVVRVICLKPLRGQPADPRIVHLDAWLPAGPAPFEHAERDPMRVASIIYTSGTTGRPKGVVLSHNNMVTNVWALLHCLTPGPEDVMLSFLPLSHTFERTVGYYLGVMSGCRTVYARSIPQLGEDLLNVRPTLLISVPRIYERVYNAIRAKLAEAPPARRKLFEMAVEVGWHRFEYSQGRAPWKPSLLLWPLLDKLVARKVLDRLGGRIRAAMSGGAALPPEVSRVFVGLGLRVLQGYGMTEASPVITCNRVDDNVPASIGKAAPGIEVRIGEHNVLQARGPNIMLGYWQNEEATRATITSDGWLITGDTARVDETGHYYITGRVKEIIVLSNGEKIPPVDMEIAISKDPLFEQLMVLGEGKPYLSVLAVVNRAEWDRLAALGEFPAWSEAALKSPEVQEKALKHIAVQMHEFPGYAQVRRVALLPEPWSIENGLLTPTMKLRRAKVVERYADAVEALYAGHH